MAGFDESEVLGGGGDAEYHTCQICSKSEWITTSAAAADGWKYFKTSMAKYSICPECADQSQLPPCDFERMVANWRSVMIKGVREMEEVRDDEPMALILPARFYPRLDALAKECGLSVTAFFEQMLATEERAMEAERLTRQLFGFGCAEAKQTIVRMTVDDDSPVKFRGKFDTWCCPWSDVRDFLGELLEQDEAKDGKITVSFEILEIAGSFEDWCYENDVEMET